MESGVDLRVMNLLLYSHITAHHQRMFKRIPLKSYVRVTHIISTDVISNSAILMCIVLLCIALHCITPRSLIYYLLSVLLSTPLLTTATLRHPSHAIEIILTVHMYKGDVICLILYYLILHQHTHLTLSLLPSQ